MPTKGTCCLAALLCLSLSGCFIEVTAPEGGRVETVSGSLVCSAGEVCMVEVADTAFDETFRAVPDLDSALSGWNARERGLGAGDADSLRIVTSGFAGSEILMNFLSSDDVFYLQPIFSPDPDTGIVAHRVELDNRGILDNLTAVLEYATQEGLSTFNVDAITRQAPGSTLIYARENGLWEGQGQNRIDDFGLDFAKSIAVDVNPANVAYPQDYEGQKARKIRVEDPYCKLRPEQIVFPKAYLGNYKLPEIKVTSIGKTFSKIAHLKDVWQPGNPSYITSCTGDVREGMQITLERLRALNVDTVVVYPWTTIDNTVEPWRVLNPAETLSSTMYDEDLSWFVATAKSLGLKVIWRNQIQALQKSYGDYQPYPEASVENVIKSYRAMEIYLAERGAFLEEIGVDGVSLTSWFWAGFSLVLPDEQFLEETRAHIQAIKSTFSGQIIMDMDDKYTNDPATHALIDVYELSPYFDLPEESLDQLSVSSVVPQLTSQIEYYRNAAKGTPITILAGVPSRGNFSYTGYLEETFCSSGYNFIDGFSTDCTQQDSPTDFSIQAILYEAILEASFGVAGFDPGGIAVGYWMNDTVVPSTTFPNLAYSIRNKPAEVIVQRWFQGP